MTDAFCELLESRRLLAALVVSNAKDHGIGSLRTAINNANFTSEADVISFNIQAPATIALLSALPAITQPLVIDGAEKSITVDGTFAGSAVEGIEIKSHDCVISGMVIQNFSRNGVLITGASSSANLVSVCSVINNGLNGVAIQAAANGNVIGQSGEGNVIGGNGLAGVLIHGTGTSGNLVQASAIGLAQMPNLRGVEINSGASANTIGGDNGNGNNITGNTSYGVLIDGNGASDNTITSNSIEANHDGIGVKLGAANNIIGGTTAGAGNSITENTDAGIVIEDANTSGNSVQGNFIGTNSFGEILGNGGNGITVRTSNNTIGGSAQASNTIAFNAGAGVFVDSTATNVKITFNSIQLNGGLGIDLSPTGLSANDAQDPDTGANNLQNFPVISSVTSGGGSGTINGSMNSTPNTTFNVQFFASVSVDASGNGEGATLLGTTSFTTSTLGAKNFSAGIPNDIPGGAYITAAATSTAGNTSEFSTAFQFGGIVRGSVFNDLNGINGKEPGEPGIKRVQVFADLNENGTLDVGEPSARSNRKGNYLLGLAPGSYLVRSVPPAGMRSSTGPFRVTIANGSFLTKHFGETAMGLIRGKVFNTADGSGLAGFRIYLDLDADAHFDRGEPFVRSDVDGKYQFVVSPGSYRIRETLVEGYTPVGPTSFSTTLSAGGTSTKNFELAVTT